MVLGLIAACSLAALYLWSKGDNRIQPLDRKDLSRLRRYSDEMYRESVHPFDL
jgi:hypothetical protein